ncbi:PREDICTED: uncharacterized protein LOC105455195, partial [Wasmannia auropunctata]|uniref:uncharacterized protein LOC105455195 n=1 Tax=Wasmannia auropunctata TaxID=64793 RepID=UPI0005ED9E7B
MSIEEDLSDHESEDSELEEEIRAGCDKSKKAFRPLMDDKQMIEFQRALSDISKSNLAMAKAFEVATANQSKMAKDLKEAMHHVSMTTEQVKEAIKHASTIMEASRSTARLQYETQQARQQPEPGVNGEPFASSTPTAIQSQIIQNGLPVAEGPSGTQINSFASQNSELTRDISELRKTLQIQQNTKVNIKRDYKLTAKLGLEFWMDYLRSELGTNGLLWVIDPAVQANESLDEETRASCNEVVRDIMINHMDENYHNKVIGIRDPREIVLKLKEVKRIENNVTSSSVRARLYQTKMRKNETMFDFAERFEAIIREYDNCEGTVPLGIEEKRAAFYQAVVGQVSELRVVNLFSKKMNGIDMSYEEIKNYVSQLEAEKKSDQAASTSRDSVPKVQMVRKSNVTQRGTESMKCYN